MTDNVTSPASLPQPRSSSDQLAQREAALQALASQPAPSTPPGAVAVLANRVLLHTSWDTCRKLLPVLPDEIGGLVLQGVRAGTGIKELRKAGFARKIVIDRRGYALANATEDDPFVLHREDQLFDLTLEQDLQSQRDAGADVALTPTGYLPAGDSDALRAAIHGVAALDRDDVVFSVPLGVAWFTDEHISHLIAELSRLTVPKAVFLGGQFDPMKQYKAAVVNLRRLVAEAGDVAVFRTDLTGFDAMSHGAFATAIGSGSGLRHVVPFGQAPQIGKQDDDDSPSLLFGELMSFHRGSTLQDRFGNTRPPVCTCRACGPEGRALNTFLHNSDSVAAHQHTLCTWAPWITDLLAQPTLRDRAVWWRNRCIGAIMHADAFNTQIKQPGAFTAPETLQAWAELPAWLSADQPTTRRRSRTR
jgi:hypothetical protein